MISRLVTALLLTWTSAKPDYAWRFPEDHWAHPGYATEWWYFTGHLDVGGTPRFAYQFTIFKVCLSEAAVSGSKWSTTTLFMGHAAITDLSTGEHRFSEVVQRLMPAVAGFGVYPDPRIAWCHAATSWELMDGFAFGFADAKQHYAFNLQTQAAKPIVLQGANGYSRKGGDAASQYYSETRATTRGTVDYDGRRYEVTGTSWMDKEFGSSMLARDQTGWDWFSLQLDDGRELMLYVLRHADNTRAFASGTLVDEHGNATYLGDFTITSDASWTKYPARWQVHAAGLDLTLTPLVANQENVSHVLPGLFYWEGAVRISGGQTGRGFAELTGYGTTLKPALGEQ